MASSMQRAGRGGRVSTVATPGRRASSLSSITLASLRRRLGARREAILRSRTIIGRVMWNRFPRRTHSAADSRPRMEEVMNAATALGLLILVTWGSAQAQVGSLPAPPFGYVMSQQSSTLVVVDTRTNDI